MPDPKKNTAFTFSLSLVETAARPNFKANPTISSGDFKVSIDEGAFNNLATLPTVAPASGRNVKVVLSAAEMNGDRIVVQAVDAAGAEWDEVMVAIQTTTTTTAELPDAVWDEPIAGHLTAGSTGAALNAAGSAGDPWTTPLPGAYGGGTAGNIIGNNLNATVSSRSTQTSVDNVQADTDNLQTRLPAALVGGRIDANVGAMTADTVNASALATDAVNEIVAGVLNGTIESGRTLAHALRLLNATNGGKLSGGGTSTETVRDINDTKDRIVATVDAQGNRTAITLDLT